MIFQGQEMLENQQFSSHPGGGLDQDEHLQRIVQLYRDLIGARRDLKGYTPGLEGDQCSVLWSDNTSKLGCLSPLELIHPKPRCGGHR